MDPIKAPSAGVMDADFVRFGGVRSLLSNKRRKSPKQTKPTRFLYRNRQVAVSAKNYFNSVFATKTFSPPTNFIILLLPFLLHSAHSTIFSRTLNRTLRINHIFFGRNMPYMCGNCSTKDTMLTSCHPIIPSTSFTFFHMIREVM